MIDVHSINGELMYINPDMIETIRITPDTVLFLENGKRILVKDSPEEVIDNIVRFRRRIYGQMLHPDALFERLESEEEEDNRVHRLPADGGLHE